MHNITVSLDSFVGHQQEKQFLHDAFTIAINQKQVQFALVQGDFGAGKTWLVQQFLKEVRAKRNNILIAESKCSLENDLSGLTPFNNVLRQMTIQGNQKGIILGDWGEFVKDVVPAWVDVFTAGTGTAISKTLENVRAIVRGSTFSQENVFVQFTNAVARLTEHNPAIIVIEDIHWADASSLRLFFHLSRNVSQKPVFIICTYRPVEGLETGTNAELLREVRANLLRYGAREVILEKGIDVYEYISKRYPLNNFPEDVIKEIANNTNGHPLFVSEIFSFWEEKDVIRENVLPGGKVFWEFDKNTQSLILIPETIDEVIGNRLSLLKDQLKHTLVLASVEGEDFTGQVVARLQEIDDLEAFNILGELENRYRLIREVGSHEIGSAVLDFYQFAHHFFQHHIYNHLSKGQRRILHKRIGECLESIYIDRSEIAAQLALHFQEAHEYIKAAEYSLLTAEYEKRHYNWHEVQQWCDKGLKLLNQFSEKQNVQDYQLRLLELSANSYEKAGEYAKSLDRFLLALKLADEINPNSLKTVEILVSLAAIYQFLGNYNSYLETLERGRKIVRDQHWEMSNIYLGLEEGWAFMQIRLNQAHLAVAHLTELIKQYENLSENEKKKIVDIDEVYNTLGVALSDRCDYQLALENYKKAVAVAEQFNDVVGVATFLLNIAELYYNIGDFEQGLMYVERGEELSLRIGDMSDLSYAFSIKGTIHLSQGKYQKALGELAYSLHLGQEIGAYWNVALTKSELACAYLGLGNLSKASEYSLSALEDAQNSSVRYELGYILETRALIEMAYGNWGESEKQFRSAIRMFDEQGNTHYAMRAMGELAQLFLKQERIEESYELLGPAIKFFQEKNLEFDIHQIQPTYKLVMQKIRADKDI